MCSSREHRPNPQRRRLTLTIHEALRATGRLEEAGHFARAHDVTLLEGDEPWPTTPLEEPAGLCTRPLSNSEATDTGASFEPIDDCIEGFKVTDPARSPMLLVTALVTPSGETAAAEVKGLYVVNWTFVPG
jgi:hypothetical protein